MQTKTECTCEAFKKYGECDETRSHHPTEPKEWEEEFDKNFMGSSAINLNNEEVILVQPKEVKSFIAKIAAEAERKGIVKGLSNNGHITHDPPLTKADEIAQAKKDAYKEIIQEIPNTIWKAKKGNMIKFKQQLIQRFLKGENK